MTQKTLLFYDLETTGLEKSFNQVIQFAAIRTDLQLNEVERYRFALMLRPDCVPSARAAVIHRQPMTHIHEYTEARGIEEIHRIVNKPGTLSGGYNTLGFDDEFLRFSFYRNLLTPYTHQFANGCGRFDVLPMVIIYYLFDRDRVHWPQVDGKPSFKLEHINQANQLATGPAHDAMVDVAATVELARLLYDNKNIWDYLLGYFDKFTDSDRIESMKKVEQLDDHVRLGLAVSLRFGVNRSFLSPVLMVGRHRTYRNQVVMLHLDEMDFAKDGLVVEKGWSSKKLGEQLFILPTEDRYLERLQPQQKQLMENNLSWLQSNSDAVTSCAHTVLSRLYQEVDNVDTDASLYQVGFYANEQIQRCQLFHASTPSARAALLDDFVHPVLKKQAIRYVWRNYPELLPKQYQADMDGYWNALKSSQSDQLGMSYKGERRLLPSEALQEIAECRKDDLDLVQQQCLAELESYLKKHFEL